MNNSSQTEIKDPAKFRMGGADLVLLTGMHRSGTSFIAKRFHDAGCLFPGDLLPANADNPQGYWEAREVVQLNNRILQSIGSDWRNHSAISSAQMQDLVSKYVSAAACVLQDLKAQAGDSPFAVKDPRFSRLLPIWSAAADSLGWNHKTIATVRDASEVALSLFRRVSDPKFKQAAVANPSKALLLWARYNLDLSRHLRGTAYRMIAFVDIQDVDLRGWFDAAPQLHQQGVTKLEEPTSLPKFCKHVERLILSNSEDGQTEMMTNAEARFDACVEQATATGHMLDGPKIAELAGCFSNGSVEETAARIAFVSGAPASKGHIYRVQNRIESLIGHDCATFRVDPQLHSVSEIADVCDVLLVFRAEMTDWLKTLYDACQRRGVAIIYDIDDLVFDPEIMSPDHVRFLERSSPNFVQDWQERSARYRDALSAADGAIFPTTALAAQGQKFNENTWMVPNGLNDAQIRLAASVELEARSEIVIGYASGTATHDRDFETIADTLLDVLCAHPNTKLRLQGPISGKGVERLDPVASQVERVGLVPYHRLSHALGQFDINIAPLELGNPFCEGKSQLKYFEAAIVGVPSVVAHTQSFAECIDHGVNGFLAATLDDWKTSLENLILDADLRQRMGARARLDALQTFSVQAHRNSFVQVVEDTLGKKGVVSKRPASEVLAKPSEAGFSLIEVLVALAIASLVSMLILGSLRQQYQLIDRVQNASVEALDLKARTRLLSNVITNTVQAWPEAEDEQFLGSSDEISGVSGETIFGVQPSLRPYSVTLAPFDQGRTIRLLTPEGDWELGTVPLDAKFEYYGHDGVWYGAWPADIPPARTLAEMEAEASRGELPALIRIRSDAQTLGEEWVFATYNTDGLSLRASDLTGRLDTGLE